VITEDDLLAAAVTIRVMPHAVLSQRLVQLEEEQTGRNGLGTADPGHPDPCGPTRTAVQRTRLRWLAG
jgi:hypothetical protein